jgi:hypothetical protein
LDLVVFVIRLLVISNCDVNLPPFTVIKKKSEQYSG